MWHRRLLQLANICSFGFSAGFLVWLATGRFGDVTGAFLFAAFTLWALYAILNPAARFPGFKDSQLPAALGTLVLLLLAFLVIFAVAN